MKTFKDFIAEMKHNVGNCVNSFDDNGESNNTIPYRDVSHFSDSIEDFKTGRNKPELKISKDEFLKHCHVDKDLHKVLNHKDTEFLHDKENNMHIMYDSRKDVHHFYK